MCHEHQYGSAATRCGSSFPSGDTWDIATAIVREPGGTLLVTGNRYDWDTVVATTAVARIGPDGTLDASFGEDGLVELSLGADFVGLTIDVLDDAESEGDEDFWVRLRDADGGARVAASEMTVYVANDDMPPPPPPPEPTPVPPAFSGGAAAIGCHCCCSVRC